MITQHHQAPQRGARHHGFLAGAQQTDIGYVKPVNIFLRRDAVDDQILIEMIRQEGCAYGAYRHPYKYIFLEESVGFRSQPSPLSSGRATTLVYPPAQLFDLEADPKETENLAGKQPAVQAELHRIVQEELLDFADCLRDRFPDVSTMTPGQMEALDAEMKALGYTGPGSLRRSNPARENSPARR